jgi:hypothetical protein
MSHSSNDWDNWPKDFPINTMMKVFFLILALGAIGAWFVKSTDFSLYKFFAPRQAEVQREVFEQTPSYVQGKNTYIARLRAQYETADEGHKESLRQLILSEAETIDDDNLTERNRNFVNGLRESGEESR